MNSKYIDYSEKIDRQHYLGCYRVDNYKEDVNLIFDFSVKNIYYKRLYRRNYNSIEIMQLVIIDNLYTVVLKTYWLRLIQRVWKKVFIRRQNVIKLRKTINCQKYFEYKGKYSSGANYLPGLKGMMVMI